MIKKLLTATAVIIITAVCALAQVTPQVYYTFDQTNPLSPTIGTTNLNPTGAYTINSGGQVGRYISINRAVNQSLIGQSVPVTTAVTIEFLWKASDGWDENRDPILFWHGNMAARFAYPNILFYTTCSTGNDDFAINLQKVGPASWSYYKKGWHHFAFVYNASTGFKALYIDGVLPAGFSKNVAGGTITGSSWQIQLGTNQSYQSGQFNFDEVAVYNQAISASQAYSDYRNTVGGQHYTFSTLTPPAPPSVTAPLDSMEFPIGYTIGQTTNYNSVTGALTQLKNYMRPRYPLGHIAPPNFNWMAIDYMSGYYQPSVTNRMMCDTAAEMGIELSQNWNYYFLVNPNTNSTNYSDTNTIEGRLVAVSNRNRQYKTSALSFWVQQNPSRYGYTANGEYMTWQNCPANNFIRNGSGNFIDPNGATSTTRYRSPASPLDSIKLDASVYRRNFSALAAVMTDTLNMINDNDEILTLFDSVPLRQDPAIVSAMGLAGFGNMRQYAAYGYQNMFKVLKDSVRSKIPAFANVGFSIYQVDGWDGSISPIPYWRWNFSQYRKCNEDPTFGNCATFDFYPRYVWNWRFHSGAWRGLQPWIESKNVETVAGAKYGTPFVGAGWDVNEENNMRPAQWLGLLKVLAMQGARSFYAGYFNEASSYNPPNPPPANPKGYIWQVALPSYAQAATEWLMDNGYNDTLLNGDVPNNYQFPTCYGYRYYSGSEEILTAIRKKKSGEQYAIATSYINSTSQQGGTPLTDTAIFVLNGKSISVETRRQGSVYGLDLAKDTAVIIQYDDWQPYYHPQRWGNDIYMQAEHYGKYVSKAKDVRTIPYQPSAGSTFNFIGTTTYLTYIDSASYSRDTLTYQLNLPASGTYYLWVRMRSYNGTASGFSARMDNLGAFTQNNVIDTAWKWYRISVTPDTMKWTSLSAGYHSLKLIATSARTEIDKFLVTPNTNIVLPEGTPGSSSPCGITFTPTVTPSGPVTQCGGNLVLQASAGNFYVWSNGSTTQSITVSSSGTYTVTVTDGAGCTGVSAGVSVTIKAPITASITPASTQTCGSNKTLTAVSASSYLWSTGATTQAISAGAGTYTVTVTNSVGCTGSTSASITSSSAASATISPSGTVTQCGGTVTLTASNNTSYLWSNGSTTQGVSVGTGTYTVTVTNSTGCTAVSAPTYVVINSNPTVTISPSGTQTVCNGLQTTLGANGGLTYLWSTGATTQSITASASGTYTVTATNANSCTGTASTILNYVACTCSAPTGVTMPEIWRNGARVNWTYSATASAYRVTITSQADTTKTQTKYWRSGTTGIYFNKLTARTLYKITITPICGSTTGESSSIYFTTRQ